MGKRAVVLFVVVIALVGGACGSDSSDDDADTLTPQRTTTTVAPAAVALEARLIKTVPAGYKQEPDEVGDTGPSDLDKAVRDDGSDDAREVLTNAGFVAGYQRYWTSGENEIINFLYQFSNPAGPADYMARTVEVLGEGNAEVTVTQFNVPGVAGARGFHAHSAAREAVFVVFVRGDYLAQVNIIGTDATVTTAAALSTEQYNNLA
jgi:hypothetical protein